MLRIIPQDKIDLARKYIDENFSPTELLALCMDYYENRPTSWRDVGHGYYGNTVRAICPFDPDSVTNCWDDKVEVLCDYMDAIDWAMYEAAHKTFDKLVVMLLKHNVEHYLKSEV